jgi:hypothetical protein
VKKSCLFVKSELFTTIILSNGNGGDGATLLSAVIIEEKNSFV